jgi:hypothetical protein
MLQTCAAGFARIAFPPDGAYGGAACARPRGRTSGSAVDVRCSSLLSSELWRVDNAPLQHRNGRSGYGRDLGLTFRQEAFEGQSHRKGWFDSVAV